MELVQLPDGSFDGWAYPEAGDALYARTALQAWAQENPDTARRAGDVLEQLYREMA